MLHSGGSRGESSSLSIPASRGCLDSLALGPFQPLQSQQLIHCNFCFLTSHLLCLRLFPFFKGLCCLHWSCLGSPDALSISKSHLQIPFCHMKSCTHRFPGLRHGFFFFLSGSGGIFLPTTDGFQKMFLWYTEHFPFIRVRMMLYILGISETSK